MNRILNALGFQAGWWACVASVRLDRQAEALVFCGVLVALHLRHCVAPRQEAKLAALALVIGIAVDSALQYFSVIRFLGLSMGGLSPLWLWMLWVIFAMTINSSMGFLQDLSWKVSAAMGLVFGPISYLAGAQLGAAQFDYSASHILALAAVWALVLPVLVGAGKKLQSSAAQGTPDAVEIGGLASIE